MFFIIDIVQGKLHSLANGRSKTDFNYIGPNYAIILSLYMGGFAVKFFL